MKELSVDEIREILEKPAAERSDAEKLQIGFTLLGWQRRKDFPPPHGSIREFATKEFPRSRPSKDPRTGERPRDVSYPTLIRWVKVAEMLSELRDRCPLWELSKLVELLGFSEPEQRERYLSLHTDAEFAEMDVRELRTSIRRFRGGASRVAAEQLASITAQAVERHLLDEHREWLDLVRVERGDEHEGSVYGVNVDFSDADAVKAATFAVTSIAMLENSRSKWQQTPKPRHHAREWSDVFLAESLIREDEVTDEQVVLAWTDAEEFVMRKAGTRFVMTRNVRRKPLSDWVCEPETRIGELACLVDTRSGSRNDLDAIIRPTPWEGNLTVQLPADHGPRLYEWSSPAVGTPLLWRVNAEGVDGAAAIALGLLQTLAEANPDMGFTTTCSHGVHVPGLMLDWLASLRNIWVQHVFCGKLDEPGKKENDRRFKQLSRFRDHGVPTVALIVTGAEWQNSLLRKRAAHLLDDGDSAPRGVIVERPYPTPDALRADGRRSRRSVPASQDALIEADQPASSDATLPICRRGTSCSGCETLCGYHLLRRLGKLSFSRLPLT